MSIRTRKAAFAFAAVIAITPLAGCAHDAGAKRKIPFTTATVATDANTATLNWAAPGAASVDIYEGNDPASIARTQPVGHGASTGSVTIPDLPNAIRTYFELVPDRGAPLVVADRSLHLASAPNFRDAGGYRTGDGKWVRMGLLYRSDQLDRLSHADLAMLHSDGLHLVCDLRTDAERNQGMDKLPDGAQAVIADVAGGDSASSGLTKLLSSGGNPEAVLGNGRGARLMMDANRQFVQSPTAKAAYKALFERLADPKSLPAVFHCTSGKDRTGWAQAIFLSIMGVPRDIIMQDYLLSNGYLKVKNDRTLAVLKGRIDPALLEPVLGVRAEYLQAGFDVVDKEYGSMDGYVRKGLGLSDQTIEALRTEFLAGA